MESDVDTRVSILRAEQPPSRTTLDREERLVKDGILRMGSLVESQIRGAVKALERRGGGGTRHRTSYCGENLENGHELAR